jgi:hypothetical protein
VDEGLRLQGGTAGRFAAVYLADAITSLAHDVAADKAVELLSEGLLSAMHMHGLADPAAWGWPAAAQTVMYSAARSEVWRLGDCHVSVNGDPLPASPTPLDVPALGFRSCALEALIAGGASMQELIENDPTWDMLLPLLELQHNLRNHDDAGNRYAYGLIDGRRVPQQFIQVYPVPAGAEIVFASDGYLTAAPTLAAAEAELAHVLEADPLLFRQHQGFRPLQPGTLSFDDRCYVRFAT